MSTNDVKMYQTGHGGTTPLLTALSPHSIPI